jgi:hypothetical protein
VRARRLALAVVLAGLGGLAACGEPEPAEDPISAARARQARLDEARERARSYEEAREARRLGLGAAPENSARIRQDLLERYGARLTPFQRSALLTEPISTREEAEARCLRWIAENERFER